MHKNIKTAAGCFTNVTCNVSATDGREVELTAYIAIGQERRPVLKSGANIFAFPAVEYGQHLYEIRADGKPLIFGFLLVRPSAFPVAEGVVDYTLNATLDSVEALHVDIELTPGPRGYSAYDIAVQDGFEGTEAEWLEHMRQLTATLAVEQVTPLMERAETAADKSEREAAAATSSQERAAEHAQAAAESEFAAAGHRTATADEVTKAAAEVEKAKQERETAATHATAAAKSAQDALANQQGAEQAAQDAQTAKSGAEQAKADADAASQTAAQKATEAAESAAQAAADKTAAEKAKADAQAAQSTAETQASIATAAAEAAQAPESIAAQAARPATMVLLREEMERLLGDSASWVIDTDGQKIVVHTNRLEGEQLAAVEDVLARFVPGFVEVVQYNHDISIPWQEIPEGFTVIEWLESVDKQRIYVQDVDLGTTEDALITKCLSPYSKNPYRFTFVRDAKLVDGGSFNLMALIGSVHEGSVASWYGKCSIVCEIEGKDADGNLIRPKDWVTDANLADFAVTPDVPFELRIERRVMSVDGVARKKVDANYTFPATKVDRLLLFNWWVTTDLRIYNVQLVSEETGAMLLNMICCLDATGAPCMLDRVSGTVFYNNSTGDFLYPGKEEEPATYSLRRSITYAQLTEHGVRRLYHVPKGYNGTVEEYAAEHGFKPVCEQEAPEAVEGKVWEPVWRETEDELVLEWEAEEVH